MADEKTVQNLNYSPRSWVNDVDAIFAEDMNRIENGIKNATEQVNTNTEDIADLQKKSSESDAKIEGIETNISGLLTSVQENKSAINAEQEARESADSLITESVSDLDGKVETNAKNISANASAIEKETEDRKKALEETDGNVNALTERVGTAETNIKTNTTNIATNKKSIEDNAKAIGTETTDRTKADSDLDKSLSKKITDEATARSEAIEEEANTRSEADEALDNRLTVVEKQVANINMDNVDLRNIVLDIEAGVAQIKYPVGTQIITDWDRIDASGNKTNYKPEWNIVHYENVPIKDDVADEEDRNANVMYLEWDKTIPDGIAFCNQQALQCFDGTEGTPNGLPAGTYSVKMKAPNGSTTFKTKWNGKYATFTLTKEIPNGGVLRLTVNDLNGTTDAQVALHFSSYGNDISNSARIEEAIVNTSTDALPEGATFLGEVWGEDVGYGKLNHPEACYYGDNTWSTSDLRQWLNGEGKDWWTKQTRYNIKPNIASSMQGFLTGLDADLKSHIKAIKNQTIGNNQKYPNQKFITYDKIFLHSFNQSNITTDFSSQYDNEGKRWDYYKQLANGVANLNNQGMFKIWNTYPILIRYAINAPTSAQYVFSRSARLSLAYSVHNVHPSGYCSNTNAGSGFRCLPACVIASSQS